MYLLLGHWSWVVGVGMACQNREPVIRTVDRTLLRYVGSVQVHEI